MDPDPKPYIELLSVLLTPFFTGFTVNAIIGMVILCLLLVMSALISSSETAYFSLQPADIDSLESMTDPKSQLVLQLRENPKTLLATILIGNNFVNVTITLLATYIVSEMFDMANHPAAAFLMELVVITSLVLLIGEIIPKILAAKKPVRFARFMARTLQVLIVLFKPLSKLLVNSTSFMDKHLERKKADISMDDLSTAVDIATESSTPLDEKNMLRGIASFTEKEVSNVMKPRIDIVAVEVNMPFREMLDTVIKSGFSRIPVYEESLDSTADITVSNATLTSTLSEGVCIEGINSITLNDCDMSANNTDTNGNATFYDTIMIYQSMSGDADSGTSTFTMNGGTLTSKNGHVFHVTNTNAVINLNGVKITNKDSDNILLSVCADGWTGDTNKATLNASSQALEGTILVGSDSKLTLNLTDGSSFKGTIDGNITNAKGDTVSTEVGTVSVTIDKSSTWTLTADTYITSFDGDLSSVDTNGYTLYVNGVAMN